jgi:hypothetical protein
MLAYVSKTLHRSSKPRRSSLSGVKPKGPHTQGDTECKITLTELALHINQFTHPFCLTSSNLATSNVGFIWACQSSTKAQRDIVYVVQLTLSPE